MRYKKMLLILSILVLAVLVVGCKKHGSNDKASIKHDYSKDPVKTSEVDIDSLVYEDKEGDVQYNIANVDQIILPEKYTEKHKKMIDMIDVYNKERDAEAKRFIDEQRQEIRTMIAERNDSTLQLSYQDTVVINRIDDDVFSFLEEIQSYTGGAHYNYAMIGRNYKSSNGKELTSDEIFTNENKLKDVLIDRITEEYGEEQLFPEWKDTLETHFKEKTPLNILVGTEFVDVMFDPYYLGPWSTGTITITLLYKEYSDILNKKYFNE